MNAITTECPTHEAYLTVGSVRGYHGDDISEKELGDAICAFQKKFEATHGYCCAVRIVKSAIVFQNYAEDCFDLHCINYPRFPLRESDLDLFMKDLAADLLQALAQERITVVRPTKSVMYERPNADGENVHQ